MWFRITSAAVTCLAVTGSASAQNQVGDYRSRYELNASYAPRYRISGPSNDVTEGIAVGGEAALRLTGGLGLGAGAFMIGRRSGPAQAFAAMIQIHTVPSVVLKLGGGGVRSSYQVFDAFGRAVEDRKVTMPALLLGGEFIRQPFRDPRVAVSLGIDNYVMFYSDRKLYPTGSTVDERIVMVPLISVGAGIMLGKRTTR